MAWEKELPPRAGDQAVRFAVADRVTCAVCGRPARSTREREARKCAYHLDVFKTPP